MLGGAGCGAGFLPSTVSLTDYCYKYMLAFHQVSDVLEWQKQKDQSNWREQNGGWAKGIVLTTVIFMAKPILP